MMIFLKLIKISQDQDVADCLDKKTFLISWKVATHKFVISMDLMCQEPMLTFQSYYMKEGIQKNQEALNFHGQWKSMEYLSSNPTLRRLHWKMIQKWIWWRSLTCNLDNFHFYIIMNVKVTNLFLNANFWHEIVWRFLLL